MALITNTSQKNICNNLNFTKFYSVLNKANTFKHDINVDNQLLQCSQNIKEVRKVLNKNYIFIYFT